jgi:hypothetical protein
MDSNSSTHIQVATAFSYTFSNSDLTIPGFNSLPPVYTANAGSSLTFCNSGGTYTPNSTQVRSTSPNTYFNFNGQTYYSTDIATGSVFSYQLPYTPSPAIGTIRFGDEFYFSTRTEDDTVYRTISGANYSSGDALTLTKRSDGKFNLIYPSPARSDTFIISAVGSLTYITYTTYAIHGLTVGNTVSISGLNEYPIANITDGIVASIPTTNTFTINIADAGIITTYNQVANLSTSIAIVQYSSLNFASSFYYLNPAYPEYTTGLYGTGAKITYNGKSYESIASVNVPPDHPTNYAFWWPVSLTVNNWISTITYFIGERVIYGSYIYKSLIDLNYNHIPGEDEIYWALSDSNYPGWSSSEDYAATTRVIYNSSAYQARQFTPSNANKIPGDVDDYVFWMPINQPADPPTTFVLTSPDKIVYYDAIYPTLTFSTQTSNALIPFITGSGTEVITFSSGGGFQSVPTSGQPLKLTILQSVLGVQKASSNFYITVDPFTITVDPVIPSSFSLVTYQPFGTYTYSIPDNLVNVILRYSSNTSSSLVPYITEGETQNSLTFGSTIGLTTAGTRTIEISAFLNDVTPLASNSSTIITTASSIAITPEIPTGSLSLFKFEPFNYVFTTNLDALGLSFQINRSSPEVLTFAAISEDLQTVVFEGTFQIGYTSTLSLVVDLLYGTTIIDTRTILMTVGQGRFFPPSANQNYQLYQYENISDTFGSNPSFLTALPITSILSLPSLPIGLSFGGSCNAFYLQGTPSLQVNQSNYQIIGSNSSNGKIVTSIISIRVNPQQVLITPKTSTLSGLTVNTPITPITLTSIQPITAYRDTFRYTWTSLPDGFVFQDINGSNVSQPFKPEDSALTIILAGSPSIAFANTMSTYSSNLYQTRLTATQTDQNTRQTSGTSLFNFSLGETVLINVSISVILYKSKPLGPSDVLITAKSLFPTSTVLTPTYDALPPGLSLQSTSSIYEWRLIGTPTEVNLTGSYTFTAINSNGVSQSISVVIPINPNYVTFGGSTPSSVTPIQFIVSRPLTNAKSGYYTTPIVFSATSTAEAYPITYTSSIDLSEYGLILNPSTGTLTGIPTVSLSLTTVTITGTDSIGTIGTTTIQLAILEDTFTWSSYSPTYFQNKEITPFRFVATSTLSERLVQSYSSIDLPAGLVISEGGILSGSPTVGSSGSFTIIATTGYSETEHLYNYTIIQDQLLIIQVNGTDDISRVFSGIQYRAIQYSSDSFVDADFSVLPDVVPDGPTLSMTSNGLLSGDFTSATLNINYTGYISATFGTVTGTSSVLIRFSTSSTGTIHIPTEDSSLTFSQPSQPDYTLFEYVPYSIPIQAIGSENFIYYFSSAIPLGFQLIKDGLGVTAALSGISPTLSNQGIIVYAKINGDYAVSKSITLRTITPFFINPQMGAGAYTSILRNDVLGNAAQNARDNRTFPEVNPLAGPLMAPRAPDVTTPDNCLLNLCKKPCPTCRTMM